MKGRIICCFVIALHIVSLVSATGRPFQPNDGFGVLLAGQNTGSSGLTPKEGFKSSEEVEKIHEEANLKGMRKIGSSPPSCENKCFGCLPCEAIQVPTTSRHGHMGVQYANYEPEGWKCKCGPSFYSP